MNNNLPTAASFLVTENCNLACKYCYELGDHKNNKMSYDVIHKGLEYLCNNAKVLNKDNKFHVMIFGGEPFLYPDIVEEICEYGYQLQQKNNIKFTATVITNGTQMNDHILYILTNYKNKIGLTCQLSIDGIEEAHNLYRVTKSGEGSFKYIKNNIDKFKLAYTDKPWMLNMHGCINKKTLPFLYDSYVFFREKWEFNSIWFMPIHEEKWDTNDVVLYQKQLNKICDYIIDKCKETQSLDIVSTYTPINKCLYPYKKSMRPCGAGKTFVTVVSNGDIYPCHMFYFNNKPKEHIIGNVYSGIDENNPTRKMFVDITEEDMTCDKSCKNTNCYRCMGSNWLNNGAPTKQIKGIYCKMSNAEKDATDRMKKEIANLDFVDLNEKRWMRKEREWVEDGQLHQLYINSIGEEVIFTNELNQEQEEQVENYYNLNAFNILARSQKLVLQEIQDIKEKIVGGGIG